MRKMCTTLAAFVALIAFGVVNAGGDKVTGDLKKIQGKWIFVSQVMEGKERPKDEVAKISITFTGDKWSVSDGEKVLQAGTHTLNSDKKPAQVDAKVTEGEGKGGTMLGIYELKGNKMTVCFDPQGKERPTSFTAKGGQFMAVIERVKKK